MKFYNLYIDLKNSPTTYNAITEIFGLMPTKKPLSKFNPNQYDLWWYQVTEDNNTTFDFINEFLDILEPKYERLAEIGVKRSDILFWLVYEYSHQCSLSFHPEELKRLGKSGIVLNIDCHKLKDEFEM